MKLFLPKEQADAIHKRRDGLLAAMLNRLLDDYSSLAQNDDFARLKDIILDDASQLRAMVANDPPPNLEVH